MKSDLTVSQKIFKRLLDIVLSALGLIALWWLIILSAIVARLDTGKSGFFTQERIGQYGKPFKVYKIRTMRVVADNNTTVTTRSDSRITPIGKVFRKLKIDELPQLYNVLIGEMSFVGPRPDVPGYANKLVGDDRIILNIKPGITGPATLAYRNEEELLNDVEDPVRYNDEVIYPDKVRINKEYIQEYSLMTDIRYIIRTVLPS